MIIEEKDAKLNMKDKILNKIISGFLLICFLSNTTLADCDWSKIVKNSDNTYTYPEQLHLCVGQLVQDNATKDRQISDLNQAIQLKDLALTKSDARMQLWMDTSDKLQNRLTTIDELAKKNEWLMFGLGALTVIGAGFIVSKTLH